MSESIIVRCGNCQQRLRATPKEHPTQVKCPQCGTQMSIAGTSTQSVNRPAVVPVSQLDNRKRSEGRSSSSRPSVPAPLETPFQQPTPRQPKSGTHFAQSSGLAAKQPAKRNQKFPVWVITLLGGMGVSLLLCCGVLGLFVSKARQVATTVLPIDATLRAALPPRDMFPLLGNPEKEYPSGVKSYFVILDEPIAIPGRKMKMRVFVPPGEHAEHSLPCVLIAPAGTPMIHGATLEPYDSYDAETLPYAEAGFAVIQYSLDGALDPGIDPSNEQQSVPAMIKAYHQFKASGAGVVNGRNALEYATYRLTFIDPRRIHCAGHSSAGALSLLLAAHEPRINRCIAFAAAYDLESRMGEMTSDPQAQRMLPGIKEFIRLSSPMNHIEKLKSPVFVFHARDDSNVPFSDAEKFVSRMKAAGKAVTFEVTPTGEHYDSMIDPGIPKAIAWLKEP